MRVLLYTQDDEGSVKEFKELASSADIILVEGVQRETAASMIADATSSVPNLVAFDSCKQLEDLARLGGLRLQKPG